MSLAPKKALSNLSNVVGNKPAVGNLKRTLESPNHVANLKKKNAKKNQENACLPIGKNGKYEMTDATKAIENKIKNIALTDETEKASTVQTRRQVLARAVKSVAAHKTVSTKPCEKWKNFYQAPPHVPKNVVDYDRSQLSTIESEPIYAYEIFKYYSEKEKATRTEKYMGRQKDLNEKMRAVLVDWLVEVQQNFELNHETLYLSVKFVDQFLMRKTITRARFQLLGLTAVFLACKIDERMYPVIDDFVYISDDAYSREDFIRMEMELLKVLEFNLNYPLSYSFLRRYARCGSLSIETLTLARYILETSLMEYSLIDELDSKVSAASLLLALKMKKMQWTETLTFYSGYTEEDLASIVGKLNKLISTTSKFVTIKNKYSDTVFFEVAKIRPLTLK